MRIIPCGYERGEAPSRRTVDLQQGLVIICFFVVTVEVGKFDIINGGPRTSRYNAPRGSKSTIVLLPAHMLAEKHPIKKLIPPDHSIIPLIASGSGNNLANHTFLIN
ncbi:PREDICTED: uncharacterized protein LOC106744545 [Dinoponera quadriceps]|uniref:Uncharacterized protein LOC106744545 n=1 Tax=Dinoponera quadriceps TaxID=609295 RepID=A0A6P3X9I0_DINQU|nr:PREDICTED: uncharacterized protein LOC106744545 [Dinoponera quadriceps]